MAVVEHVEAVNAGKAAVIRLMSNELWGGTYRHDFLLVRAAMLVRRFPLTQRGRLRNISVGVNGG